MAVADDIWIPSDIKLMRERFDLKWMLDESTGCWVWTGSRSASGYGTFSWSAPRMTVLAHRASVMLYKGLLISERRVVCHRCDIKACVNPDHLWVGTHKQNSRDAVSKGRTNRGEKNPLSKLTEAQAIEIFSDPRRHTIIANEYGVSHDCVSAIKRRTRWAHVT